MICFDRDDKPIVADRHQFVLNRLRRSPHQSFQRTRDSRTKRRNVVTNLRQLGTGAVVEFTCRQNLVADARNEGVQLSRQKLDELPQHWRVVAFGENRRAR
jgi:hypothetical protein